jgi:hypothetical protein
MAHAKPQQAQTKKPIRRFHQARATLMLLSLSVGVMAYTGLQVTQHAQRLRQQSASSESQPQIGDYVERIGQRAEHPRRSEMTASTRDFGHRR